MFFLYGRLLDISIISGVDGSFSVDTFADSACSTIGVVLMSDISITSLEEKMKQREEIVSYQPLYLSVTLG